MIRCCVLTLAALFVFTPAAVLADGLIIVRRPDGGGPNRYDFAPLEIKKHKVDVEIDGQVATTAVDQTFHNATGRRLEGTYMFPMPEGGHIDKFTMKINGETVGFFRGV